MKRLHGMLISTLALGVMSAPAFADLVHLKNGRVIEGKVRRENGRIYIQQPDGTIIISADKVDHIEEKESILDVYENKLKDIDAKGPDAGKQFAELGKWCQDKGMSNQATECYTRSIGADPNNDLANGGLGRVKYSGKWMTLDEANLARGMVKHGDTWVSPEAKQDLVKLDSAKELQEKNLELERMKVEVARLEAEKAVAEADKARSQAETERYRRTVIITDPYLQGYVPAPPGYRPPPYKPGTDKPGTDKPGHGKWDKNGSNSHGDKDKDKDDDDTKSVTLKVK